MKQRELKFRAWDKKENKMLPSIGITEDGTPFLMTSVYKEKVDDELRKQNASCLAFGKDDVILMQFTGLTDKNGVEIYEGDVLKVNYSGHWMKEVVIYEYGAFKKRYHEESGEIHNLHFTSLSPNNTEVIGNLYETPDLLTPQPNP